MSQTTESNVLTLLSLLTEGEDSKKMEDATFESSRSFEQVWEQLQKTHSDIKKEGVGKTVREGLSELLKEPYLGLFAGAWNTCRAVWALGDPEESAQNETHLLPVGKLTLTHSSKPKVDICILGVKKSALVFDLEVSLLVYAAVLTIRGGRIYEMNAASLAGGGKLSYEGATFMERATKALSLPGTLRFRDGLPIRPTATKANPHE